VWWASVPRLPGYRRSDARALVDPRCTRTLAGGGGFRTASDPASAPVSGVDTTGRARSPTLGSADAAPSVTTNRRNTGPTCTPAACSPAHRESDNPAFANFEALQATWRLVHDERLGRHAAVAALGRGPPPCTDLVFRRELGI
jgi:hypothetical protein